jgi:hypothetical protein
LEVAWGVKMLELGIFILCLDIAFLLKIPIIKKGLEGLFGEKLNIEGFNP